MSYPENTAGGLMITEFLSYTSQPRVKDVLDDLQTHGEEYSDFDVQYAYGIILGCLLGVAALLWKGNPYLGLVVGVALAANTLVAVILGGFIPLFLRGIKTDPALASGPLLTPITDMCGFFFVLSFASILFPKLSG
jgi:Mg/Co/Ni transporter MgtE